MEEIKQADPAAVVVSDGVKGRCNYEEKRIFINEGMDELQNIKTAIHEIAHATLHDTALAMPEQGRKKSRTQPATAITGNGRTYRGFLIKSAAPAWAVSAQTTHRQYRSWKRNWKALKNHRKP